MSIPTAQHAAYAAQLSRQSCQEDTISVAISEAIAEGRMWCECWVKQDPASAIENLQELGYTVETEIWQHWHGTNFKQYHSLLTISWYPK